MNTDSPRFSGPSPTWNDQARPSIGNTNHQILSHAEIILNRLDNEKTRALVMPGGRPYNPSDRVGWHIDSHRAWIRGFRRDLSKLGASHILEAAMKLEETVRRLKIDHRRRTEQATAEKQARQQADRERKTAAAQRKQQTARDKAKRARRIRRKQRQRR